MEVLQQSVARADKSRHEGFMSRFMGVVSDRIQHPRVHLPIAELLETPKSLCHDSPLRILSSQPHTRLALQKTPFKVSLHYWLCRLVLARVPPFLVLERHMLTPLSL